MLVDIKVRNSEKAESILHEINVKRKELDELCYQLRECLMLEANVTNKKAASK